MAMNKCTKFLRMKNVSFLQRKGMMQPVIQNQFRSQFTHVNNVMIHKNQYNKITPTNSFFRKKKLYYINVRKIHDDSKDMKKNNTEVKEKEVVEEVFDILDTNQDGIIDRKEMEIGLKELDANLSLHEIQEFLDQAYNKSGFRKGLNIKQMEKELKENFSDKNTATDIKDFGSFYSLFEKKVNMKNEQINKMNLGDLFKW